MHSVAMNPDHGVAVEVGGRAIRALDIFHRHLRHRWFSSVVLVRRMVRRHLHSAAVAAAEGEDRAASRWHFVRREAARLL